MRKFLTNKVNLTLLALFAASLGLGVYFSDRSAPNGKYVAEKVEVRLNNMLLAADKEAKTILARLKANPDALISSGLGNVDFYWVEGVAITRWTGNAWWPAVRNLAEGAPIRYIKSSAGDFIYKRYDAGKDKYLVAVIPLKRHYLIQNDYLKPWQNPEILPPYPVMLADARSAERHPVGHGRLTLFYLSLPSSFPADMLPFSLFCTAVLCFCAVLYQAVRHLQSRPAFGFLILFAGIAGLRLVMLDAQFPAGFITASLFDPKFFASSAFNPNLGDLLFNSLSVFILCLFLFLNYSRFKGLHRLLTIPLWRTLISTFCSVAIFFGMLFLFVVIQTIYNNSSITLSISNSISFDGLRWVALICVLVSWLCVFMFAHVFIRVLSGCQKNVNFALFILFGASVFILVNEITGQHYLSSLAAGVLYVLIVVYFRLDHTLRHFRYPTFGYFLVAVLVFSASGFYAVTWFSVKEQARSQAQFAGSFLLDRDNFGEYLLDEVSTKISSDAFIQARISGPFMSRDAVKQKVRQVFLPGYFNKYKVDLLLFAGNGDPLDDSNPENFSTWLSGFDTEASKTEYPGIYFIGASQSEAIRMYLSVIPIKRKDLTLGFMVISLSLRKDIPENVYPELLVDNRFQRAFRSKAYSYAVIHNHEILYRSGDYNYESFEGLSDPDLFAGGVIRNGYRHVAAEAPDGRIAVVSVKIPFIMYRIADFSFLLICGIAVLMLFLLGTGFLTAVRGQRISLTARIQLILNLSFFLPLIAVSVITLGLTSRSAQEQLNAEYLSKSRNFAVELSSRLVDDEDFPRAFDNQLVQQARLANLDANIFTPDGHLVVSTQPLIFEYQLLAPVISPQALQRVREGERTFILQEVVGGLKYYVAYAAVAGGTSGKLAGILAIPYFQSQYSLEAMQISILSNILIIFIGIFFLLLIVSFVASNWLTKPLSMITQKIGKVSLTASNQPIDWPAEDEIGMLVREYNQMIAKLSESKLELERTQRERTWREIAQQVAHEIKNPLTPMKLTLQQLQRMNVNSQPDALKNSIASLLTQIDALDGIASSFSAYAKMPEPVLERVSLIDLLTMTTELHNQAGNVFFETKLSEAFIQTDRQLLSRVISNLILNGLQSGEREDRVKVTVTLQRQNSAYLISVTDNGPGIEETIRDKIFLPHFSTKQAGSGLGLAISKQGVEQLGGKIWFESEPGRGTRFFVQLPGV